MATHLKTKANPKPARRFPAGHHLLKELDARHLSQADLADIMDRPTKTINAIVNGTKEITIDTAYELEKALGIPANVWLELDKQYRLHMAEKNKTELRQREEKAIELRSKCYHYAPVRELVKLGWITFDEDYQRNTKILSQFLRVSSLSDDQLLPRFKSLSSCFRHSAKLEPNEVALYSWLCQVRHEAEKGEQTLGSKAKPFDGEALKKALPQLLQLTVNLEGIMQVAPFLQNYGVQLVFVPHLQKTYLDGAVLFHNAYPVIALTLRHDRLDNFWFSLLHELGHLLLGHCQGEQVLLDSLDEVSTTRKEQEDKADQFAQDLVLPPDLYQVFKHSSSSHSKAKILNFAQELGRHPGLVLGRLQFDTKVSYGSHRELLEKVKHLITM